MDPRLARALAQELARRSIDPAELAPAPAAPTRVPRLLTRKHAKQFEAFSDPSRLMAILAGRGSGKTTGAGDWLLEGLFETPRATSFYFGLTRDHAKELLWERLKERDEQFKLGLRFNESTLVARAKNGARLWLMGADKPKSVEKARGFGIKRAVIEECGSMGSHLKYLVQQVLRPRTVDYQGQICLIGTPNAACVGYFHEITNTQKLQGWSVHRFTMLDNPFMPNAAAELEAIRTSGDWDEDAFSREFLARWVRSGAALVYAFDETRNVWTVRPQAKQWWHVLGIDLGFRDACGFQVWSWCKEDPALYDTVSIKLAGLDVTDIAEVIGELRQLYRFSAQVADTGGLGVTIVKELNKRHSKKVGLIEAAKKTDKHDFIELMNADLRKELIKVRPNSMIADEWRMLQWAPTKPGDENPKRAEDPRFDNHASDAGLYGYRAARHFRFKPADEKPKQGSNEWEKQTEARLAKELDRRLKKPLWEQDPRTRRNNPLSRKSRAW